MTSRKARPSPSDRSAHQTFRRPGRAGPHRPRHPRGWCLRAARTQRRREDHDRAHPATLLRPDGGTARVGGHDVVREPAAVRRLIGLTGQFSAVDSILTGEENLLLMARLRHLGRVDGRRRVSGTARALRAHRCRPQAARDLFRRDAPASRPGHEPGRPPADRLPRRTHHRSRPPEPRGDVADRPRARRRRDDHPAHHPVPGGGGRARPADRRTRSRTGRGQRHPEPNSNGSSRAVGSGWSSTMPRVSTGRRPFSATRLATSRRSLSMCPATVS